MLKLFKNTFFGLLCLFTANLLPTQQEYIKALKEYMELYEKITPYINEVKVETTTHTSYSGNTTTITTTYHYYHPDPTKENAVYEYQRKKRKLQEIPFLDTIGDSFIFGILVGACFIGLRALSVKTENYEGLMWKGGSLLWLMYYFLMKKKTIPSYRLNLKPSSLHSYSKQISALPASILFGGVAFMTGWAGTLYTKERLS